MRMYPQQTFRIYPDSHPRGLDIKVDIIQTRMVLDWMCGLAVMPDGKRQDACAYRHTTDMVWGFTIQHTKKGQQDTAKYTELLATLA